MVLNRVAGGLLPPPYPSRGSVMGASSPVINIGPNFLQRNPRFQV